METDDYTVDRAGWLPGPWDQERDQYEWDDRGLPCLIVRGVTTGALCGYVHVPPGHPWHGRCDVDLGDVEVHGGLTYSDARSPLVSEACHPATGCVPPPGDARDGWWVGFDCAHLGDILPRLESHEMQLGFPSARSDRGVYRDVDYVRKEVATLVTQALAAARRRS